jgi:hypothetical protein
VLVRARSLWQGGSSPGICDLLRTLPLKSPLTALQKHPDQWPKGFALFAEPIFHPGRHLGIVLLRHGHRRPFDAALAPQHGHRGKVLMSARIKWARMVAIEFGMWRSGRAGGASGSIIIG